MQDTILAMRASAILVIALAPVLAVASPALASPTPTAEVTSPDSELIAVGLIVEYDPGAPVRDSPGVPTGSDSVTVVDLEMGRAVTDELRTVEFDEPQPAEVALVAAAQLQQDPAVVFAEPDWIVMPTETETTVAPRTSQSSPPWGLDRIDQRSGTNGLYTYGTTGSGVDVYVIDSGIRSTHVEFTGRIRAGVNYIPDGRGTEDCSGHGTHVAGTIAGTTYGVAKQATVVPVRVFPCEGGTPVSVVISGLDWVIGDHTSRPAVVNLSLGGAFSASLNNAVAAAVSDGIVAVVASGNETADACSTSPASETSAITVNASTIDDTGASFSNFGSCTDLYAPGVDVLSAFYTTDTAAAWASGTSMAAPHVAGAAARLLQRRPTLTPAQVWNTLDAATTTVNFGVGGGDPNKLLYADPDDAIPDAPTGVTASAGIESLSVTWTAPTSGVAPTFYAVQFTDDSVTWTSDDSTTATSTIIDGRTPGTPYWVRVRSENANGTSDWVTSAAVTPLAPTAPGSVTGITALVDDTTLETSWTAPTSTGGRPILYYEIATSADDSTWVADDTVVSTSATIDGLSNGTPYRVRVTPVNVIGSGASAQSSSQFTPRVLATPSAPQTPLATAGNGSLAMAWGVPADDGGRIVSGYALETSTDDSTWTARGTVTGTTTTLTGLANGQPYAVRIAAINVIGQGPWVSTTGTPTAPPPSGGGGGGGGGGAPPPPPAPTAAPPGAPTITSASADDATVSLAWAASDDTGGAEVDSFAVELRGSDVSLVVTVAGSSHEFTSLTNGDGYRVRVAAINSAGQGDWSDWTSTLIPVGPADAPVDLSATPGDASAVLTWQAPEQTGGSSISGYVVEVREGSASRQLSVATPNTTLIGLSNAIAYSIRVAAVTDYGAGKWSSSVSVTPLASTLSEPRNVRASRVGKKVTVSWSAPASGTPIRYAVFTSIKGKAFKVAKTTKGTRLTFTVSSSPRTLRVQVGAIGATGAGPRSAAIEPRLRSR
jgi:subtilisin family serine protease